MIIQIIIPRREQGQWDLLRNYLNQNEGTIVIFSIRRDPHWNIIIELSEEELVLLKLRFKLDVEDITEKYLEKVRRIQVQQTEIENWMKFNVPKKPETEFC